MNAKKTLALVALSFLLVVACTSATQTATAGDGWDDTILVKIDVCDTCTECPPECEGGGTGRTAEQPVQDEQPTNIDEPTGWWSIGDFRVPVATVMRWFGEVMTREGVYIIK